MPRYLDWAINCEWTQSQAGGYFINIGRNLRLADFVTTLDCVSNTNPFISLNLNLFESKP